LWIIPGILAGLLTPALRNEKQKLSDQRFISLCRLLFFIHIILTVLLIAVALIIYLFFLPPAYFNGFLPLLIMIPGYLIFVITTMLAAYFSANRLLKVNLVGAILCCVVIILLDLLLIPSLSYKGAAIANLIAYSVTTIYFIYRSTSVIQVSLIDFFAICKSDFDLFSGKILITDKPDA